MPKDIIDFTPDRQDPLSTQNRTPQSDVAEALPYVDAYPKQFPRRRDDTLRWIVLAMLVGTVVAFAFVNYLAK
ncbi:MAG TPA: hypothetical protein VJW93_11490 [Candidatus Acidoferrales bacterium]|nr:hypothetical protein [Candidatus Acidoferrales bacterium]